MNRKEFFKKLGLGTLVVAVAPKILAEPTEDEMMHCEYQGDGTWYSRTHRFYNVRGDYYPMVYSEAQLEADRELSRRIDEVMFSNILK